MIFENALFKLVDDVSEDALLAHQNFAKGLSRNCFVEEFGDSLVELVDRYVLST